MTLKQTEQQVALVVQGQLIELGSLQGLWTEQQYFRLSDHHNRLIEFADGDIEVLPMPTDRHQVIVRFLLLALLMVVQPLGGTVLFAPLRLQIRPGKYREPDILLLRDQRDPRRQNAFWLGADLVVEIVSPDDPKRDLETKRADYAEAGIPEYWIVEPDAGRITVLRLAEDAYVEHGVFGRGQQAVSALLPGFGVAVDALLDAE